MLYRSSNKLFKLSASTCLLGLILAVPTDMPLASAISLFTFLAGKIPPLPGVLGVTIENSVSGAKILQVYDHTGAKEAGLKAGDIITRVAGEIVSDHSALITIIRRFRPGDAHRKRQLRRRWRVCPRVARGGKIRLQPQQRPGLRTPHGRCGECRIGSGDAYSWGTTHNHLLNCQCDLIRLLVIQPLLLMRQLPLIQQVESVIAPANRLYRVDCGGQNGFPH